MKKIFLASLGMTLAASSVLANQEECPPPPHKHHHHLHRKHHVQAECDDGAAPVIRREHRKKAIMEQEYDSGYISQHNYYGKLLIGFGYAPKMKFVNLATTTELKAKGRATLGVVGAGYLFPHNIRADLEFFFNDGFKDKRQNVDGKLQSYIGFLNLYYDFQMESRLVPFINAGAGYARDTFKLSDSAGGYDHSSSGFAFQVGAGVSYEFRNRIYTEFSYRYIEQGVKNGNLRNSVGTDVYSTKSISGKAHAAMAGLRVRF